MSLTKSAGQSENFDSINWGRNEFLKPRTIKSNTLLEVGNSFQEAIYFVENNIQWQNSVKTLMKLHLQKY